MIKNIKWLFLVSLTFVACNNDDEVTADANSSDGLPLTSGSANFSKYVSLGNSLTAGFSDGALFIEGQKEDKETDTNYLHKGLAQRSFTRTWTLADDTEVSSVNFEDGLLTVILGRIVPESHKRKDYL